MGSSSSPIDDWQTVAGKLANCLRYACDAGRITAQVADEADSVLLAYRRKLDEPVALTGPADKSITLDDLLEKAAEVLPEGWSLRIDVERGSGGVTMIRPDGSEEDIQPEDMNIKEQFARAILLCCNEATTILFTEMPPVTPTSNVEEREDRHRV